MRPSLLLPFLVLALPGPWIAQGSEFAPGTENDYEDTVLPFLERHGHECHDENKSKAGLRVDQLSLNFESGGDLEPWLEVMDASSQLAIVNPAGVPEVRTTRFQAEVERSSRDVTQLSLGIRKTEDKEDHLYGSQKHPRIPSGPHGYEIGPEGVLFRQDGSTYSKGKPTESSGSWSDLLSPTPTIHWLNTLP